MPTHYFPHVSHPPMVYCISFSGYQRKIFGGFQFSPAERCKNRTRDSRVRRRERHHCAVPAISLSSLFPSSLSYFLLYLLEESKSRLRALQVFLPTWKSCKILSNFFFWSQHGHNPVLLSAQAPHLILQLHFHFLPKNGEKKFLDNFFSGSLSLQSMRLTPPTFEMVKCLFPKFIQRIIELKVFEPFCLAWAMIWWNLQQVTCPILSSREDFL